MSNSIKGSFLPLCAEHDFDFVCLAATFAFWVISQVHRVMPSWTCSGTHVEEFFFFTLYGFSLFLFVCFKLGSERRRLETGVWNLRTQQASQGSGPDLVSEKCLCCSGPAIGFLNYSCSSWLLSLGKVPETASCLFNISSPYCW